jgi:hypothetical protein
MTANGLGLGGAGALHEARESDLLRIYPENTPAAPQTQAEPAANEPAPVYSPSPIKPRRARRTRLAMASIRPRSGTSWKTITRRPSAKSIRLLVEMREAGEIPFEWLADNTRWMRKPSSFTGIEACLNSTSNFYRRDLWAAMPAYVEVWCEKDALAGVLMEETEVYDVPIMTARGYSSLRRR